MFLLNDQGSWCQLSVICHGQEEDEEKTGGQGVICQTRITGSKNAHIDLTPPLLRQSEQGGWDWLVGDLAPLILAEGRFAWWLKLNCQGVGGAIACI